MADKQESNQDYSQEILANVNVKLRDIEEKQSLIKDRILLIGENLISEKKDLEEELMQLKMQMKKLEEENYKIKSAIQRLVDSQDSLARKSEVQILERQFKMFQPLEFARISDVENIVKRELQKQKKKIIFNNK